jgi:hypothetical protein
MDQLDFTNGQAAPATAEACGYHIGKIASPCARCGMPYQAHWPELSRPKRMRAAVAEVCSVCSYPVNSDQHRNHCRG